MKTFILMSALMCTSVLLSGQDLKKKEFVPVDSVLHDLIKKFNENNEFRTMPENRDLLSEFNKKFNPDSSLTEHFPGASRYYAKRPVFSPYGSSFIKIPDTTNRYYLIIVDPLRNTVTKY